MRLLGLMMLMGCASKRPAVFKPAPAPTITEMRKQAQAEMPEPVAKIEQEVNWTMPLDETPEHPGGVLISEEKAAQVQETWIRYEELRDVHEWSLVEFSFERYQLEQRVGHLEADNAILRYELQPTWWERNKVGVVFSGGILAGLIGAYASASLVAAINQ